MHREGPRHHLGGYCGTLSIEHISKFQQEQLALQQEQNALQEQLRKLEEKAFGNNPNQSIANTFGKQTVVSNNKLYAVDLLIKIHFVVDEVCQQGDANFLEIISFL